MRYYDPQACPDCRAPLPPSPVRCPACALPLSGQTAGQLQSALRYADQLLVQLRRSVAEPLPAAPAPYPVPVEPVPPTVPARRGLRASSVPTLLLGLGALCLLVAAVVFLAVAWSWLGFGGRTAVLVSLTAAALGGGLWLGGRGLRVAAESLVVVGLGLLLLDLAGAGRAGWVEPSAAAYGGLLVVAGLALTLHRLRLGAAQVAAAAGLALLLAGLAEQADAPRVLAAAGVLAFAALALLGRALAARLLPPLALLGGAASWLVLAGTSLEVATDDPSLRALWLDGDVLGLLTAAALLAVPAAYAGEVPAVARACLAGATTVLTVALTVPAVDESATVALLVAAAAVTAWSLAAALLPGRWLPAAWAPLALVALPLVVAVPALAVLSVERVLGVGVPFSRPAGVRLAATATDPHPLVLLVAVTALAVAVVACVPASLRRQAVPVAAGAVALGVLATPASYGVPLAVAVLPAVVLAAAGACLVRRQVLPALLLLGLATAATLAALPSAALTTVAAAVLAGSAGLLALRAAPPVRPVAGGLLPLALGGGLWAAGEVLGADPTYRSLLVLLVLGALALLQPRVEIEVGASVAVLAAAAGGVDGSTALAVHLTLGGALLTTSALVHRDRRPLAWAGGLLLAAATWVRLADVGITAPEAYTLPSAVALLLVGLHRLLRDPGAGSAVALVPGLVLGTVPSLLWVLAEPVGTRAVLLGGACLALVLAGTRLRWSAPLLVGVVVGGVLALRELAPYAAVTPQWVLIGAAGGLLTAVGVTWERRVVDLRRATAYVERLR